MASSIAAITTGIGGVVTTADNSGDLNLQSGTTTIVSITSAGAAVTGTLSSTSGALNGTLGATTPSTGVFTDVNTPNTFGFKNRIINGAMVIDQRNAGASVTNNVTGTQYSLDRWNIYGNFVSKFTVQQNAGAVTPPVGFKNYLGVTSSAATTVNSTDTYIIVQKIEGFNTADLAWGTANAATVTLSFRVYSSLTGTFGGSILNSAQDRSYPFTYSIPVANTWTTISVTIAGDTTGTWIGATNGIGLSVFLSLGTGSTLSGTAGAWAGAQYYSATGAVNVVSTNGATFYITGVQLEKGSTATSFDVRDYGRELMMCQRYYVNTRLSLGQTNGYNSALVGIGMNSSYLLTNIRYPVVMRALPTLVLVRPADGVANGAHEFSAVAGASTVATDRSFTGTFVDIGVFGCPYYTRTGGDVVNVSSGYLFQYTASAEL
jgi:hypothetical protein